MSHRAWFVSVMRARIAAEQWWFKALLRHATPVRLAGFQSAVKARREWEIGFADEVFK